MTGLHSRAEFDRLAGDHRRELMVHCYRFMGSLEEGEDMLQEALLRAWERRRSYAGTGSARAWLYRIATNVCLDELRRRKRRGLPHQRFPAADPDAPFPPPLQEPVWLDPIPDAWLPAHRETPEARYAQRESVSLAFLAALQQLTPPQRAALILRDVLGWSARETADLLDATLGAVNSALYRARQTMEREGMGTGPADWPPSEAETALLEAYVAAWFEADADGLAALLAREARFAMPPFPCWYAGREPIRRMLAGKLLLPGRSGMWRLVPTRANRRPAFGLYRRSPEGDYDFNGVLLLELSGDRIAEIHAFLTPSLAGPFAMAARLAG